MNTRPFPRFRPALALAALALLLAPLAAPAQDARRSEPAWMLVSLGVEPAPGADLLLYMRDTSDPSRVASLRLPIGEGLRVAIEGEEVALTGAREAWLAALQPLLSGADLVDVHGAE